jgi:hypothetical protein
MDEFCKSKKVFFADNDRISYSVKKSKYLFNEFRGSMNRSFKYTKNFEDHPDLSLLNKEWVLSDTKPTGSSRARSLKELSQKKERNSNIMVVCPSPHENTTMKDYDSRNKKKMESELGSLQKLLDSNYEAPNLATRSRYRSK